MNFVNNNTVVSICACRSSGENGKGGYKYKNDIKLRFNADLGCYPPAQMPSDAISNSSCNSNEDSSSTQYPQSEGGSSHENSQSMGSSGSGRGDGRNSDGSANSDSCTEACDLQGTGTRGGSSIGNGNSQKKSAKETVPAFALHPSGLHYIPVVLHTDGLSGRIQETGVNVCHPISIPVNFGTPLVAVQNCHIESPMGNVGISQAPILTLPTAAGMPPLGVRLNGMHSRKRSHQEHVSPTRTQAPLDREGGHPGGSYPGSNSSGSPGSYTMNHSPPMGISGHVGHSSIGSGTAGRMQHNNSAPGSPYLSQHSSSSRLGQSGDRRAISAEDCHRLGSHHAPGSHDHIMSAYQQQPSHMFQNGRHMVTAGHHGNMFSHPRMTSPRAIPTEQHVQMHGQYSP